MVRLLAAGREVKHRPALYALIRLHAELHGRMKQNQIANVQLRADMRHVEHVLRLLEPGFNTRGIAARRKYKVNPIFRHRSMFRFILAVLRTAQHPLTAQEIAAGLMKDHGMDNLSRRQIHDLGSNVTKALKRYPNSVTGDGARPQRWEIRLTKA
jgi:hypothetical protein